MRRTLQVLFSIVALGCAAVALGYSSQRTHQANALAALLQQADVVLGNSSRCLQPEAALPLLDQIIERVEASGFDNPEEPLAQASSRLLAPAVQCRLWIRGQALTFDLRDDSEAGLGRRVAEALTFEEARAEYLRVAQETDPERAAALLKSIYQSSFAAAPTEGVMRHASAIAHGFALAGADPLPSVYRAKFVQTITTTAKRVGRRDRRGNPAAATVCSPILKRVPGQIQALHQDYDYPDSILGVLSECPHNIKGGVS